MRSSLGRMDLGERGVNPQIALIIAWNIPWNIPNPRIFSKTSRCDIHRQTTIIASMLGYKMDKINHGECK